MKNSILIFLVLILGVFSAKAANYYVATNGNDSNSGSSGSPFYTLQRAVNVASSGDYIYVRGGTYNYSSTVVIPRNKSGSSSSPIRVWADGGVPIFNFSAQSENSSNRGIVLDANYWHFRGITIQQAGDNGMLVAGNNNTIEDCIFHSNHDTGLQISRYNGSYNSISQWPANNLILRCESFNNRDSDNEDADGFAAKLTVGNGNVFDACVAHHNIDDGWDLYTKNDTGPIGPVTLLGCIAHNNGVLLDGNTSGGGDKNGFKLGGSGIHVNHIVRRCIAYNNGKHGFTDNGNTGRIEFTNNTSYNNDDYNFHTRDGASHVFKNNISFESSSNDRIRGNTSAPNVFDNGDSWPYSVSSSDFVTLVPGVYNDPTSNGFLSLASGSDLINVGVTSSGISYNGSAPDLGAVESNVGGGGGGGGGDGPTCGTCASGIVNGGTYRITPRHDVTKSLELYELESDNGTNVNQWEYWNGSYQKWLARDRGNGYWSFHPLNAQGRALDIWELSEESGANVTIFDYWGGEGQQFYFSNAGSGGWVRIKSRLSDKCLDVEDASTADGANVMQWDCLSDQYNQMFRFEPVSTSSARINLEDEGGNNNFKYRFYPNPVSSTLNLEVAEVTESTTMEIVDPAGKAVMTKKVVNNTSTVDVGGLKAGIYILLIKENDKQLLSENIYITK
ncbi:RICIN domain-containing protein [Fulvivirga maritima]|uniref:RICIN domain-containing protein n=1 Tax=Fulvivirga maritima TaxID=2904247 RepID=UPI001F22FC17|nr:RICIN domain-containing protein [Fulvivirga maritima]UII28616.1 RICIN domain-containing protein [Fulvivirga maritima]